MRLKTKPYDDPACTCHNLENMVNTEHPNSGWRINDAACVMWHGKAGELVDNNIEHEKWSDEYYGCTCPTCGRLVCWECV